MDPQKNDLTEQEELKILGEILEAYIDTPIEKDAFLISDLGLDSFLIVYFISEVDDLLRCEDCGRTFVGKRVKLKSGERVEYRCDTYHRYGKEHCTAHTVDEDVLDQLNQKN